MKFNWGTGIVIAFIAFISFIMYFVINMSTNDKYNHELVTEDYYKQEVKFQEDINKQNNAKNLAHNLEINKTNDGLVIQFPEEMDVTKISGKVFLYRPSDKQSDFETPISLSTHNLLIPDTRLSDGRWNIKVDWQYKNINYLFKEDIQY
ncbi:FixH family protein [Mangrovimonas sp. ST2L15]|uniref:FixH family protein n=1 Tax=Mangrovimonas sp. ST2L15 TaxID=1645916 RepID=UPI0006B55BE4|nr:FixH family protein [Mangrovimonas sp. ST2L15]